VPRELLIGDRGVTKAPKHRPRSQKDSVPPPATTRPLRRVSKHEST
jgi:hypothetical protein